jgi:hypothetical protein
VGARQSARTFATRVVAEYVVVANADLPFDDDEWDEFVDIVRARAAAGKEVRTLSHSLGSGPNAMQRARLNITSKELHIRVAVLTDSQVSRGLVRVMGWMSRVEVRGFAPDDLPGAFRFLDVPPNQTSALRQALIQVKLAVAPPSVAAAI